MIALSVNTRIIIIMHLHMNSIIQKIMICSCYGIIESILWELLNLDGALRHSACLIRFETTSNFIVIITGANSIITDL